MRLKIIFYLLSGLAILSFSFVFESCRKNEKNPKPINYENITACILANDGGLVAFDANNNLIRTNAKGSKQWYVEKTAAQDFQILLKWPNDDVLVIGTEKVSDTLLVGYDFYHITAKKVSAAGKVLWSNLYFFDNKFSYNVLNSAVLLPSGDVCISSTNKPILSSKDPECQLIKINTDGKVIHVTPFPGLRDVALYNSDLTNMLMVHGTQILKLDSSLKTNAPIAATVPNIYRGYSDENGLLLHSRNGTADKDMIPVIDFYDLDGNLKFKKTYSTLTGYTISTINKGRNGHYIITGFLGFAAAAEPPTSDVMFMEIDGSGNLLNNKSYAFDVRDYGYAVFNRNSDYLLVGRAEHSEFYQLFSTWVVVGKPVWMMLDEKGNSK